MHFTLPPTSSSVSFAAWPFILPHTRPRHQQQTNDAVHFAGNEPILPCADAWLPCAVFGVLKV